MKLIKILQLLTVPVVVALLLVRCDDGEDKLTGKNAQGSAFDASDRITGFSSEFTGAGAYFGLMGTNLETATHVYMGDDVVKTDSVTSTSIWFNVPLTTKFGMQPIVVIFSDGGRAQAFVEVVPLPSIALVYPPAIKTGDTITVRGKDLDIVDVAQIGGVDGAIVDKTAEILHFIVPAGVTANGKVKVISIAGNDESDQSLYLCEVEPDTIICKTGSIVLNGGFEEGAGDDFTNWSKFNGGAMMTATTDADEVFGGSRTLKITNDGSTPGDAWRIQLASDLIEFEEGAVYTVTAWAKAIAPNAKMRFSTQPEPLYGPDIEIPVGEWILLSWTFTANTDETRLALDLGGPDATTYFFDDVKIIKNE